MLCFSYDAPSDSAAPYTTDNTVSPRMHAGCGTGPDIDRRTHGDGRKTYLCSESANVRGSRTSGLQIYDISGLWFSSRMVMLKLNTFSVGTTGSSTSESIPKELLDVAVQIMWSLQIHS